MTEPRHIAIVGGGIIGSSTAYFLTRHPRFVGHRVTLIEGTSIAAGASGKAGGLLALDWHGKTTASLAALSYALHKRLADENGGASKWQYRPLTTLSVQADFNAAAALRVRSRKVSNQLSWLDDAVLRSSDVLGTPETTAQVHPYLFTTSIAKLAEDAGVNIVLGTVKSLVRHSGASAKQTFTLQLANPSKEVAGVTDVVICAGPWTGELARSLGLDTGRASAITGSRAHSVVLSPGEHGQLPAQALFTAIKEERGKSSEPEIYNRSDNTAYACGATDDEPLPETAANVTVDKSAIETIVTQVFRLSPLLSRATRIAEQACFLPVGSRGGDPVIGRLKGEPNVFVGSGHSCWGITNGPGTGQCLAELILDGKVTSADINDLAP